MKPANHVPSVITENWLSDEWLARINFRHGCASKSHAVQDKSFKSKKLLSAHSTTYALKFTMTTAYGPS